MFTKEMFSFLFKVITSWQIIAVTVCLIIYFSLVSYVARLHHPGHSGLSFSSRPRKKKEKKAVAAELPESSDEDELGIDEQ
ncbi:MAG: hypothetical protein FWG07_10825 [Treponema sp.]|nr:hypothetical protein [Treponema sp.]